jgi:hypothetical protein
MGSELKLYRSVKDIWWFAFDPETGWVMFPAEIGGWHSRRPSSGVDPTEMREVPLRMGFNTGIPGAPMSSDVLQASEFKRITLRPLPMVRRHRTPKAMMETAA